MPVPITRCALPLIVALHGSCALPADDSLWEEGVDEDISEERLEVTNTQTTSAAPFSVRLIFHDVSGSCSGIVLSRRWLITSAHCLLPRVQAFGIHEPNRLTIRYGSDGTPTGTVSYNQGDAWYYVHPAYSGDDDYDDDLAIILLAGNGMSTYTRARLMGETDFCWSLSVMGSPMIAGYGHGTDPGGGEACPTSAVSIGRKRRGAFFASNCTQASVQGWFPGSPAIKQISVSSTTRDACNGDSGSPMYFTVDGLDLVAGAFSSHISIPILTDVEKGTSIRAKLEWIIDTSVQAGVPLDCQAGSSDVGPDWWSCSN